MIREVFKGFGPERRFAKGKTEGVWVGRAIFLAMGAMMMGVDPSTATHQEVTLHCEDIPPATTRVLHLGKGTLQLTVDGKSFKATKIGTFQVGDEKLEKQTESGPFKESGHHTTPISVEDLNGEKTEVAKVTTTPDAKGNEIRLDVTCSVIEPAESSN